MKKKELERRLRLKFCMKAQASHQWIKYGQEPYCLALLASDKDLPRFTCPDCRDFEPIDKLEYFVELGKINKK